VIAAAGLSGVEDSLKTSELPLAASITWKSVKVPPTSTPMTFTCNLLDELWHALKYICLYF
jgi:hypothetical protein